MKFIEVLVNELDRKSAVFEYEGEYYIYSYSCMPDMCVHETFVFRGDADGNITDYGNPIVERHGFVPSDEAMQDAVNFLNSKDYLKEESPHA